MTCRVSNAQGIDYTFCPDDLPPMADRLRAVMQGRFTDELTRQPMVSELVITTDVAHLLPRAATNGVAGLATNPYRCFPELLAAGVTLDLQVAARRFIGQAFSGTLGPFSIATGDPADYPDFFAPIDLGDIALHRQATTIRGRTVQANGSPPRTPVAGVTVEFIHIWHQFPLANEDPLVVLEPPNIVSLAPGLYRSRSAAADTLRRRLMVPAVGEDKTLVAFANVGATQVRLSDRVNLTPGELLSLAVLGSDRSEVVEILAVDGASTPAQPATITLAHALAYDHRAGTLAVRVLPQAPGTANALIRDAIPGDQTLFLNGLTDLANNQFIELSGGPHPAEYHRSDLYRQVSDADGFYRLPPLSRVAQVHLRASGGGMPQPVDLLFSPDYDLLENQLDAVFL